MVLAVLSIAWAQGEHAKGTPKITIDKERCCPLVDGKPFFAIGAYGACAEWRDDDA